MKCRWVSLRVWQIYFAIWTSFIKRICKNIFVLRNKTGTFNSLASGWFWRFSQKNSSFRWPYQRPSSSTDWARELFNGSNGSTSLVDCTWKKFCLGDAVFWEWRHKWRTFKPPWPTLPGPGRQPLGGSISLKFLLETRLQSESFDTLDDLLGFWVQKLWRKLVKIFD